MKKGIKLFALLLLAGVAYFTLWPVPVDPVIWHPPELEGFVGDFEENQRLEKFEPLGMGELTGPEAAVVNGNNDIIATAHEGWLVRFTPGESVAQPWVDLGGRPLGLDIDASGNIWVANAYSGLQKVTPSGQVSLELDTVEGTEIRYADDVAIAPNGKIYFSDATMRFPAKEWGGTLPASILDIVEHGDTGRIIEYDPVTKKAQIVMRGLNFANGVAAAASGEFILVNETGEYRVWKLWIDGPKQGESEVLLSNLPGFPDNVSRGMNDVFWVGLVSPRSADVDKFADKPFWRKFLMRLPQAMHPKAEPYGMVIGIDQDGKVLHNLQAPSGKLYSTTGVVETEAELYITSLVAPFLAKVVKSDAGL